MQRLEEGPALGGFGQPTLTFEEAREDAKNWIRSWIIPEFKRCFPEDTEEKEGADMTDDYTNIDIIKRRYLVAKAKIAASYRLEYHSGMADAYKDVLILVGVRVDDE
jgi:hypothetical protein